MDDQAAMIARRVAMAAAAWFNAPADVEAYRRLPAAVGEWNAYPSLQLENVDVDELLDDLADVAPPMPPGEGVGELQAVLRRQARRSSSGEGYRGQGLRAAEVRVAGDRHPVGR